MKKKRILLIGDALDDQNAGIHTVIKEVLQDIKELSREEVEFLLIRKKKDPDLSLKQIVIPGPKIPGLAFLRVFFIIPLMAIRYNVSAVVEFAHFGPFNLPKKIKRVTYIHDLTPILFPQYHVFNGWFLHKLFLPGIIRRADLIMADSHHTAQDIRKLYPDADQKTCINYLGVSDKFRPQKDEGLLQKNGIRQPYFLFVGTIEPRKGIDTLLAAFEIFKEGDQDQHQLVIIGSMGWKMKPITDLLENYKYKDYVIYLGFVDLSHLVVYYSMAKFLIIPSRYEGFGLPIIEAMRCGTRSIVSRNSSLEEIGRLCGSLLFETDNSNQLAKLMQSQDQAIEQYDGFDWKVHTKILMDNIRKLL